MKDKEDKVNLKEKLRMAFLTKIKMLLEEKLANKDDA